MRKKKLTRGLYERARRSYVRAVRSGAMNTEFRFSDLDEGIIVLRSKGGIVAQFKVCAKRLRFLGGYDLRERWPWVTSANPGMR